jgi:Leucine-rich repeat (LRR) protein
MKTPRKGVDVTIASVIVLLYIVWSIILVSAYSSPTTTTTTTRTTTVEHRSALPHYRLARTERRQLCHTQCRKFFRAYARRQDTSRYEQDVEYCQCHPNGIQRYTKRQRLLHRQNIRSRSRSTSRSRFWSADTDEAEDPNAHVVPQPQSSCAYNASFDDPIQRKSMIDGILRTCTLNPHFPGTCTPDVGVSMCCESFTHVVSLICDTPGGPDSSESRSKSNTQHVIRMDFSGLLLDSLPDGFFLNMTTVTILNLDRNKLSLLPSSIGAMYKLEFLNVYQNRLTVLPDNWHNLTRLLTVDVGHNKLTRLPLAASKWLNVTQLSIDNNRFQTVPQQIANLKALTALDVSSNRIAFIPYFFTEFRVLTSLEFGDNLLTYVPAWLSALSNLSALTLSYNHIRTVPDTLTLPILQALDLGGNLIQQLPDSLCYQFHKLQQLILSSNELSILPLSIGACSQLQVLGLHDNFLTTLPVEIAALTNLRQLSVQYNRLESLPETVTSMLNSESLDFSFNNLRALPNSFGELAKLGDLRIRGNQIDTLPTSMSALTRLVSLDISLNSFIEIPSVVANYSHLQVLDASENQIADIPSWLSGGFYSLQSVFLTSNALTSIVPTMIFPSSITTLELGHNQLSSLPAGLSALQELQLLDLGFNKFSHVPDAVPALERVKTLSMAYNNLTHIPSVPWSSLYFQFMNFSGNAIESLPYQIGETFLLQTLDVSHNRLTEIVPLFSVYALDLSYNNLRELPPWMANSSASLKSLSVRDNMLVSVDNWPSTPTESDTLDLSGNQLTEWPHDVVTKYRSVTTVDISRNRLTTIPRTVLDWLPQLKVLNASRNQLTSVFDFSSYQLTAIDLSHNLLDSIPFDSVAISLPRFVYLSHNQFRMFPHLVPAVILTHADDNNSEKPKKAPPRSRVIDLSMNRLGEVDSEFEFVNTTSWWHLLGMFRDSNANSLFVNGNPLISQCMSDSITPYLCTDNDIEAVNGCFAFDSIDGTNGFGVGADGEAASFASRDVHCASLVYYGPQAWARNSAAGYGIGTVNIVADPSLLAFNSCTIASNAYPIFADVDIVRATSRDRLSIPLDLFSDPTTALPIAAPLCPDIGFQENPCGSSGATFGSLSTTGQVLERSSVNGWECAIAGHDAHSYMCSRCRGDKGFIKDGARCIDCASSSTVLTVVIWTFGTVGFVIYVVLYAKASSNVVATLIFHLQMLSFLAHGPVTWSSFVRDYFFHVVRTSNADPTALGCLWVASSQTYAASLLATLILPLVAFLLSIMVWICFRVSLSYREGRQHGWRTDMMSELLQLQNDGTESQAASVTREMAHIYDSYHRDDELPSNTAYVKMKDSDDRDNIAAMDGGIDGSVHGIELQSSNLALSALTARQRYALHWWKVVMLTSSLIYAPITLRIMQAFGSYSSPTHEDLPDRLSVDLELEFGGNEWQTHVLPLALIGMVLFVIGIPFMLYRAMHGSLGPHAVRASSFLTQVYRSDIQICGRMSRRSIAIWNLCGRGALAGVVALSSSSSVTPLLFVVSLLIVWMLLVSRIMPYVHSSDNMLAYTSIACLVATYCGASLLTQQQGQGAFSISEREFLALSWVIVILNCMYLLVVFAVYLMRKTRQSHASSSKEWSRNRS